MSTENPTPGTGHGDAPKAQSDALTLEAQVVRDAAAGKATTSGAAAPRAAPAESPLGFLGRPMSGGLVLMLLVLVAAGLTGLLLFHPWEVRPSPSATVPDAAERLARLDERVGALEARAGNLSETAGTLADRLAALEKMPSDATPATDVAATLDSLAQRLTRLEALPAPAPASQPAPASADPGALAALNERLTAIEANRSVETTRIDARIQALERGLNEDTKATLEGMTKSIAERPTANELQAVVARLAALERGDASQMARRAALAVATGALADAVRGGNAFARELAVVASLLPRDPALPRLERYADRGVATPAALAGDFAPIAATVRRDDATPQPAASSGGFMGYLGGLVTVRRTDAPADAATDATLGEAEAALRVGDVARALAAARALKAPAEAGLSAWIMRADAREDALAALRGLQARVLDGLVPTNP